MSKSNCSPVEVYEDVFSVVLDMNHFATEELSVKVIDNCVVVVEARHEERPDDRCGLVSRHFLHRYRLPHNVDPESVKSDLSDRGILTITAQKKREALGDVGVVVPIAKGK